MKIKNLNVPQSGGPSTNAIITAITPVPPSCTGTQFNPDPPFAFNSTPFPYNTDVTINGNIVTTCPSLVKINIAFKDQTYGSNPQWQSDGNHNLTLPMCSCCDDFNFVLDTFRITPTDQSSGLYNLNSVISLGPLANIKALSLEIVYFEVSEKDSCYKCPTTSKFFGNFSGEDIGSIPGLPNSEITLSTVSAPFNYSREITWYTNSNAVAINHVPVNANLFFPPSLSFDCCKDTIKICFRYSFKDISCKVCDTLICKKYVRTFSGLTAAGSGIGKSNNYPQLYEIHNNDEPINQGLNNMEFINNNVLEFQNNPIPKSDNVIKQMNEKYDLQDTTYETFEREMIEEWREHGATEEDILQNKPSLKALFIEYQNRSQQRHIDDLPIPPVSIPDNKLCDELGFESNFTISQWHAFTSMHLNIVTATFGDNFSWDPYTPGGDIQDCPGHTNYCDQKHFTIMNSGGYDEVLGGTLLPVTPPSLGTLNHSIRVGNSFECAYAERIKYAFTANMSHITIYYAAVMGNPFSHSWQEIGFGKVKLRNNSSSSDILVREIKSDNYSPYYNYTLHRFQCSSSGWGVVVPDCDPDLANNIYTGWKSEYIPLTLGDNYELTVTAGDCSRGGDFGYMYFDVSCNAPTDSGQGAIFIDSVYVPNDATYHYPGNNTNIVLKECKNYPDTVYGHYYLPRIGPTYGIIQNIWAYVYENGLQYPNSSTMINVTDIDLSNNTFKYLLNKTDVWSNYPAPPPPLAKGYDIYVKAHFNMLNDAWSSLPSSEGVMHGQDNDFWIDTCGNSVQQDCCDHAKILTHVEKIDLKPLSITDNSGAWKLNLDLKAGPNSLKKIRANIEYVDIRTAKDCQKCDKNSINFGNFLGLVSDISPLGQGKLTDLYHTGLNKISREIIWGSNANTFPNTINMYNTSVPVTMIILFPPPVINPLNIIDCCPDTIRFSIRFRFTDTLCSTCDTVITYTIVQKGKTGWSDISSNTFINDKFDNLALNQNNYNGLDKENSDANKGISAGQSGFDIKSEPIINFKLFDNKGYEILRSFDNYPDKSRICIDLNKYNLPDGVYFFKWNRGHEIIYDKLLITNGCFY